MEKVVYILGAGFSAPFGLPVISDFYIKSKDMYVSDPTKYKHFEELFESVDAMHKANAYFKTDLFNIEEILSIMEMQEHLTEKRNAESIRRYIADVIEYYTPSFVPRRSALPSNWYDSIIWADSQRAERSGLINYYGYFIVNLFNLRMNDIMLTSGTGNFHKIEYEINTNPKISYSIITFNYDLVLENLLEFIKVNYLKKNKPGVDSPDISFASNDNASISIGTVKLAKLHGSIKPNTIVPPTWNKGSAPEVIIGARKLAKKLLEEANYIRILGYSMDSLDAYMRYLLKTSVLSSQHLKRIDAICRDSTGDVKNRYENFIAFKNNRFLRADIESYLKLNCEINKEAKVRHPEGRSWTVNFDKLEMAHEEFMTRANTNNLQLIP